MVYARILFLVTLPLAAYFYLVPGAPATVRRYAIMAGHVQAYWEATKDIQGVAGVTSLHFRASGQLPADFAAFLRENRRTSSATPHIDVWGTPYRLVDRGDSYEIVSCGADRDCALAIDNLTERLRKVKPLSTGDGDPQLEQALKQAVE